MGIRFSFTHKAGRRDGLPRPHLAKKGRLTKTRLRMLSPSMASSLDSRSRTSAGAAAGGLGLASALAQTTSAASALNTSLRLSSVSSAPGTRPPSAVGSASSWGRARNGEEEAGWRFRVRAWQLLSKQP